MSSSDGGTGPGQPEASRPGEPGATWPASGRDGASQPAEGPGEPRHAQPEDGAGEPRHPQPEGGAGEPRHPQPEDGAGSRDGWQTQLTGLGGFIRMQRRLADMSLRELANLTSVSNAYLSQIERGLHQPSLRVLRSIAQALSISPEELLRRANFITSTGDEPGAPGRATEPPDTETAIAGDPRLTPAQREALLNVYRSFRDQT